jgi:tRNA A-37 threonylcarbamoyl transferase component Bud32
MKQRLPQILIVTVALAFFEYWALLVYCDIWRPAPLGLHLRIDDGRVVVDQVEGGSLAAGAGLRAGDQIAHADSHPLGSRLDWMSVEANLSFERPFRLSLIRESSPINVELMPVPATWPEWRATHGLELIVVRAVLLTTLAIATFVALKRPRDAAALIGAAFLAAISIFSVTLPYRMAEVWRSLPTPLGVPLWLPFMSGIAIAAWAYSFFALFPRVRFRSRRPWLIVWTLMLPGLAGQAVFGYFVMVRAQPAPPIPFWPASLLVPGVGYLAAALVRLVMAYRRLNDLTERRRVRVVMLGTIVGALAGGPVVLSYWRTSTNGFSQPVLATPLVAIGTFLFLALPLSFAYAILRHRLFGITTIIRQGLRYVLARRVLLAIAPAMLVLLVADILVHRDEPLGSVLRGRVWIYGGLAALALVARARRRGWMDALDRRFFRERYNAQRLLREVAGDLRRAADLGPVAPSVVSRIEQALHPSRVTLFVRDSIQGPYRALATAPANAGAIGIDDSSVEISVPIASAQDPAAALLALGPRRSEEPYTDDDADMVNAIADSIALHLRASLPLSDINAFFECPRCGTCYDAGGSCRSDGAILIGVNVPRPFLERYRIERRVGEGGMGTVYVALDALLQRRVAAKLVREDLIHLPGAAERFQREAQAAAALAHPNIVTVHDFGVSGGHAFLVMELLQGRTLRDVLRAEERIDCRRALNILRDLAAAIETAHQRQLIHRDLKPENVWLVIDGAREQAKVLDFGLATSLTAADGAALALAGGTIAGTPLYMAPEQLRGEEPLRSWDLWALAVIAFEMVCGVHPFAMTALGREGAARRAEDEDRFAGLPDGLRAYFARALAIGRDARPASAAHLLTEFEQSLHA